MSKQASMSDYADLALAVYVEELANEKRVLFVGELESPAPERLAKVARSVDIATPKARARGTRRGGRVRSHRWPTEEDRGRWDLVVIPDLSAAGLTEPERISQVMGWLTEGGILVAGTPDPKTIPDGMRSGSLDYEGLFGLLDECFDSVRMVGQAPFAGWSVVDFAPPSPELEVTFDGSLLEGAGETAQRYLALCGPRDVVLDAYAIVQIPSEAAAFGGAEARGDEARAGDARIELEGRVAGLTARLREQQDAIDAANVHAEEVERELEGTRARIEEARAELDAAKERARKSDRRRKQLEETLAQLEAGGGADAEYVQLEASLRSCGRELTDVRAESERRAVLVRDLVEQMRELGASGLPAPAGQPEPAARSEAPSSGSVVEERGSEAARTLKAQAETAMHRAVACEAEKAQLAFRLDEVRGELAVAEARFEHDLEQQRRLEAALRGTVRGLNARLAEVTELFQLSQARLALTEDDRRMTSARNAELVRQVAEVREQVELEMARARVTQHAAEAHAEPDADELRAKLAELESLRALVASLREAALESASRQAELEEVITTSRREAAARGLDHESAAAEAARALSAHGALSDRVEAMRVGYESRIAELVLELDRLGGEAERALVQVGELRTRLAATERADESRRGELDGLRLRLRDREEAVKELTGALDAREDRRRAPSRAPSAPPPPEAPLVDVAALRDERDAAVQEVERLRACLADAEAALSSARDTGPASDALELRAALGARDALVARLQSQLAHAAQAQRDLARKLEARSEALETQKEALESAHVVADVTVEERQRELDDLRAQLDAAEAGREAALTALEEARVILSELVDDLPEADGGEPPGTDGAELRRLRQRAVQLDSEAEDREVLMRSLTAQLQERDDRIRALERMPNGGPDGDDNALATRLLEMEERVARLTEELENERDARQRAETRV